MTKKRIVAAVPEPPTTPSPPHACYLPEEPQHPSGCQPVCPRGAPYAARSRPMGPAWGTPVSGACARAQTDTKPGTSDTPGTIGATNGCAGIASGKLD
jgi:hypothetical protein